MQDMDIKTKISLIRMTYDGNGILTKFTDKVYGFCNSDNTVNFIRLSDMEIINQAYTIRYILDKLIVVFSRDKVNLSNVRAYILDIDTFEPIIISKYRLEVIDDIIYEGNNLAMYHHGEKTLTRNIFNLLGQKIGEIEAFSDIDINRIEGTDYYIVNHIQIGEIKKHVTICKITDKVESLWCSNEYDVDCIADGLYSFSKHCKYEDTKVYDFFKGSLVEVE